ncbi:SF0329 family protein [Paenibacillus sp. strain BS8-2]
MRWSKLKEQIESRICDSLKSRITFNSTRYRGTHDQVGRAWITIDHEIIHDFCTVKRSYLYNTVANAIRLESNSLDWKDPEQQKGYYQAYKESDKELERQGIHNQYEFYNAIEEYLNISIEDAMSSTNPIIRAISYFDRRIGKRRLMNIKEDENNIVNKFKEIRLKAEGLIRDEGNFA